MKVVYISDSILPSRSASSIQVMKMCETMSRQGHAVTLIVPNLQDPDTRAEDTFAFYGVKASFRIGRHWFPTSLGRSFGSIIYAFVSAHAAYRARPDLIYGRYLPACWLTALFGMPTVFESHVPPSTQRPGWMVNLIFRLWRRAKGNKGVVVISAALGSRLEAEFGPIKLILAHDAADVVRCVTANPAKHSNQCLQIGYVGQLYQGKGMELIEQIVRRCPSMQFQIVGGSEQDIRYWKGLLQNQDNVIFHGHVPHEETEKLRQQCDVLIAPYQNDVRVFGGGNNVAPWMSPLKLFEYMASGKAIVCSDLPVLREILTHEETALLCDPLKPEEWEEALRRLETNPELRINLGECAKRIHAKTYTWDARVARIFSQIQDIAN
jgi:glycosyltransferase involved in cell wall biosynthesis